MINGYKWWMFVYIHDISMDVDVGFSVARWDYQMAGVHDAHSS